MGASFRSKAEILELAGCDYLTIAPKLLQELAHCTDPVVRKLDPAKASTENLEKVHYDEKSFRWGLGADPCATAKLAVCTLRSNHLFLTHERREL